MIKTYTYLKTTLTTDFKNETAEQLALIYQKTLNDEIISYLYCKHFYYWFKLSQRISFIDLEEKASIILEKIHSTLLNYDPAKNNSYLAYAYKAILNAFGGYIIKDRYKERKKRKLTVSLEDVCGNSDLKIIDSIPDISQTYDINKINLKLSIDKNTKLSKPEKIFCNIVIKYPGLDTAEIANLMHVTTQRIWIIKNKLKIKIKEGLNF